MAEGRFIFYLRVSTQKQGASGLGEAAQRKAVTNYLNGGNWNLIAEYAEVESGKRDDRPKLAEALALCRVHNATLVVTKLDRLSCDAGFLINLRKAGVKFVAANISFADEMVVGIMALIAQEERRAISKRTKDALAAKAEWYANLDNAGRAALIARGSQPSSGGPDTINSPEIRSTKAGWRATRRSRPERKCESLIFLPS